MCNSAEALAEADPELAKVWKTKQEVCAGLNGSSLLGLPLLPLRDSEKLLSTTLSTMFPMVCCFFVDSKARYARELREGWARQKEWLEGDQPDWSSEDEDENEEEDEQSKTRGRDAVEVQMERELEVC